MPRELDLIHAVVGIIMRGDTVLVGQRPAGKPYSGYWEFPGGKIEAEESSEDALKRELFEELGIAVTIAKPWFQHEHAYPDKCVLLDMWLVTSFAGEPQNKENQALRWVSLSELLELRLLEGNWPIINKIKSLF